MKSSVNTRYIKINVKYRKKKKVNMAIDSYIMYGYIIKPLYYFYFRGRCPI